MGGVQGVNIVQMCCELKLWGRGKREEKIQEEEVEMEGLNTRKELQGEREKESEREREDGERERDRKSSFDNKGFSMNSTKSSFLKEIM